MDNLSAILSETYVCLILTILYFALMGEKLNFIPKVNSKLFLLYLKVEKVRNLFEAR